MPSSLQTLDTAFPKIDEHQTTEENFLQVTNYLYMLLENLRYTLGNLGEENFNDTELESIAKLIREPVWARIEDDEGNIHTLNVTAENLLSQVSDINGNLSTLQQTASTLSSRITNTEGNISTLTQTANRLSSRISDAEGNISSLTQTVNGFSLSVSNGTSSSTIKLMSGSTVISSKSISFSGMVTFSDLSTKGSTTINGSNITTGSITSNYIRLYGNLLVYTSSSLSNIGGYIGYTTSDQTGSAGIHMQKDGGEVCATSSGAKLLYNSTSGINRMYASEDNCGVGLGSVYYYFFSDSFRCNMQKTLGSASNLWGQIYSSNSAISQSDANRKNSIEYLPEKYLTLFDRLIPRRYKLNDGTSDRYHVGFVAQEVEAAMTAAGVGSQEFGGFVKDTDEETGEDIYFLRYEEFISILVAKINALETRINAWEETA